MTNKEKIIYLGGLIDGEGYLGIVKGNPRRSMVSPTYNVRLSIASTSEKIMNWLISNFDGYFSIKKKYSNKHKVSFTWSIGDKKLYPLLKKVIPYLIIKQKQAISVIDFMDNKQSSFKGQLWKKLDKEELSFRENHYLFLRKLNHRGPIDNLSSLKNNGCELGGRLTANTEPSKVEMPGRA